VTLFLPKGIVGTFRDYWPRLRKKSDPVADTAPKPAE
jgi:hypothetical protein